MSRFPRTLLFLALAAVLIILAIRWTGRSNRNSEAPPQPRSAERPASSAADPQHRTREIRGTSAPDEPGVMEVVDERDEGRLSLALIKTDLEIPWVRMEATIGYDPLDGEHSVEKVRTFAADRARIRLAPDAAVADLDTLARKAGASLMPSSAPGAFELVVPDPDLDTLPGLVNLLLAERGLISHVEPVDVPLPDLEIDLEPGAP